MGMYTELYINVRFKSDLPESVVYALQCMTGDDVDNIDYSKLPKHPLFSTSRWDFMLRCSSYYHKPHSVGKFAYDDICKSYFLTNRSDFKNYDNEINLFLDFITPFIDCGYPEFIGYSLYEEENCPTLYYVKDGVLIESHSNVV